MSKSLVATLTSLRTDLDLAMLNLNSIMNKKDNTAVLKLEVESLKLEVQALKNKQVPIKKDEDISVKIEAIVTEEFINKLYRTK